MADNQEIPQDPVAMAEQFCTGRSFKRGDMTIMVRALIDMIKTGPASSPPEPVEFFRVPGGLEIRRAGSSSIFIGTMNRFFTDEEARGVIRKIQSVLEETC